MPKKAVLNNTAFLHFYKATRSAMASPASSNSMASPSTYSTMPFDAIVYTKLRSPLFIAYLFIAYLCMA